MIKPKKLLKPIPPIAGTVNPTIKLSGDLRGVYIKDIQTLVHRFTSLLKIAKI